MADCWHRQKKTQSTGMWRAVHWALVAAVGAYALAAERRELGCTSLNPMRRCADEDSVYVRGTAPSPLDSRESARRKLVSILSYHEKGGVWKRSLLLATVLAYVSHVLHRAVSCAGHGWVAAAHHMVFVCVVYFYWNYMNYHHFRLLKRNGVQLLRVLTPPPPRRRQ